MEPSSKKSPAKRTPFNLTAQARLILDYMMARPDRRITPIAAHIFLGVASLTARISELRKAFGEEAVLDAWEEDNRKRRFKTYWMSQEQQERVKGIIKAGPREP